MVSVLHFSFAVFIAGAQTYRQTIITRRFDIEVDVLVFCISISIWISICISICGRLCAHAQCVFIQVARVLRLSNDVWLIESKRETTSQQIAE